MNETIKTGGIDRPTSIGTGAGRDIAGLPATAGAHVAGVARTSVHRDAVRRECGFPPGRGRSEPLEARFDPSHNDNRMTGPTGPGTHTAVRPTLVAHGAHVVDGGHRTLVGRASEMQCIDRALNSARSGGSYAMAVLGEPGIGKSRVLQELSRRAEAAGFDVLVGRSAQLEREVPFGVFLDALNERSAAVFPSGCGGRVDGFAAERFEFYRAVRAVFDQLASRRPLVLVLDDLHWADPASAELIRHLLRGFVPGMVLAMAYRPRQTGGLLLEAVAHAARENLVEEHELAPLTITETAQALGERPDSPIVRSLYAESGGNPFYLEQLARNKRRRPADHATGDFAGYRQDAAVPLALRRMITQELSGLAPDTLRVLQAGSVAGDPFGVDLVTAIADTDNTQVLQCLGELEAADLVRRDTTPGQFRFRHPIVRRVVYDESMPGWRYGAHKQAAMILAHRGAPLAVRAHHIEHSATPGDETAAMTLAEAAATVIPRAPATAAGWLEAALRLLPATAQPQQRIVLLLMLARALASAGHLRECRTALEQTLHLLPADSAGDRVKIISMIAAADHGLGYADETRQLILTALDQAPAATADAVELQLELADNQWMCGQWEQVPVTLDQALAQAAALADPALLIAVKAAYAVCTAEQGNIPDALRLVQQVAEGLDTIDLVQTPELLGALANLALAETYLGRFTTALRHIERGIEASRATGRAHTFGRFVLAAATVRILLGRLHEARQDAETTLEAALLLNNDQLRMAAHSVRCWVETMSGDLPTALTAGRAAVRTANHTPRAQYVWLAHACYGQALIESGEFELGRQQLLSIGGPELAGMSPGARPQWLEALVIAEVATGRIDSAEAITQQMKHTAHGLPHREASFHHAEAYIHTAQGDHRAAAASAAEARQHCETAATPIFAARARLDTGRALARTGDITGAIHEIELAHNTLQDAGSIRLADEAAKELRTLGKRVRHASLPLQSDNPWGLTGREQSVAVRIAQGLTNREIAADLFISPKTVEKHLARIFTKLGVSTRTAVVATMKRTPRPMTSTLH